MTVELTPIAILLSPLVLSLSLSLSSHCPALGLHIGDIGLRAVHGALYGLLTSDSGATLGIVRFPSSSAPQRYYNGLNPRPCIYPTTTILTILIANYRKYGQLVSITAYSAK